MTPTEYLSMDPKIRNKLTDTIKSDKFYFAKFIFAHKLTPDECYSAYKHMIDNKYINNVKIHIQGVYNKYKLIIPDSWLKDYLFNPDFFKNPQSYIKGMTENNIAKFIKSSDKSYILKRKNGRYSL
jgi:hypothetical protein